MRLKNHYATNSSATKSINTPAIGVFDQFLRPKKAQHGFTLIMVLIFVVTLSLLAAVGMRGVITGERVVANERDRAVAFQGAESAGRVAIQLIATKNTSSFHARPIFPLGGNIEQWRTTNALTANSCRVNLTQVTTNRYDWTSDWSTANPDCSVKTTEKYGNLTEPRYVVEFTSEVPNTSTGKKECWYRVTSRATGLTGEADVILQVMFSVENQNLASDPCAKD